MQYQSRTYDPVSGEVISQRGGVPCREPNRTTPFTGAPYWRPSDSPIDRGIDNDPDVSFGGP
jgi:hypothetical protein